MSVRLLALPDTGGLCYVGSQSWVLPLYLGFLINEGVFQEEHDVTLQDHLAGNHGIRLFIRD